MFHHTITRREALRAGAAMGLPLVAASAALAKVRVQPALTVGVSTLGWGNATNAEVAAEMAQQGLRTVQLFLSQKDSRYWKYNGRSDLSTLSMDKCREIGESYRQAGVTIHSVGVYTNLIHPDAAERKANLAYFEGMMQAGLAMGARVFITEAGHYHFEKESPRVEYHYQEPVWQQMVATGKQLAQMAERHQVTVLFEPFFRGFLATAKRMRVFLEEVGSPRIRALLDPANLLENNDLEEMFGQLKPWIDCLHAKDRKLHVDRGVAAGQGDVDYEKFVRLAVQHTPNAPLILEYVGPKDYQQALAHLSGAMRKVGVARR
jgi:sugar phosphate isomerase/epimerase